MTTAKYPEVEVRLTGQDGNVFNLIGLCTRAARRAGVEPDEISRFIGEVTGAQSYDETLQVMLAWFDVS